MELVYGANNITIGNLNPTILTHILLTDHQKDDWSCGTFITFYVYAWAKGVTSEELKSTQMITMNEIHEFRRMMVADLGADEKFFWKGLKYTISCDEIEPKTTKEELEQLE